MDKVTSISLALVAMVLLLPFISHYLHHHPIMMKRFKTVLIGGYSDRRVYISQLFAPLLELLKESDEPGMTIDFSRIITRSEVVETAVKDAEVLIREGHIISAVDRVYTAFHGYLENVLMEHGILCVETDGLSALYNKIHTFYGEQIRPAEVAERVKKILRCANGMIDTINEIRNNNSIAHPNETLIQEREALPGLCGRNRVHEGCPHHPGICKRGQEVRLAQILMSLRLTLMPLGSAVQRQPVIKSQG